MELNGRQRADFRIALNKAFNLNSFKILVSDYLDEQLENIVADGNYLDRIQEVLLWTEQRQGATVTLLAGALERRPGNQRLTDLAEEFGMTSTGQNLLQPADIPLGVVSQAPGDWATEADIAPSLRTRTDTGEARRIVLERVVQERGAWINIKAFIEELGRREQQVCRIVIPGSGGTGFLVAADLIVTNHHVVKPILEHDVAAHDVHCLFDYHKLSDGVTELPGRRVQLHADWLVDSRPPSPSDEVVGGPDPAPEKCDYAVIRLAEDIGNQPAGPPTADSDAKPRGWIPVADPPPPTAKGQEVFLLQHPRSKPLLLTLGRVLGFNGAGNRLRHDANTLGGSSGSPCMNARLELVALHHAGDPDFDPAHRPQYNQAIPLSTILASLKQTPGLPKFWNGA